MSMRLRVTSVTAIAIAIAMQAPDADAKRVVMRPTLASSCPGAEQWSQVASCVARYGTVKTLRSGSDYRLLQLSGSKEGRDFAGLYVYTRREGTWRIGGAFQVADAKLVGFSTPTYNKKKIYRLDVSLAIDDEVALDGDSFKPARTHQKLALFCGGVYPGCVQLLVACDTFVDGKAYWTFRGKLEVTGDVIKVSGDRSKTGGGCDGDDQMPLPTTDD